MELEKDKRHRPVQDSTAQYFLTHPHLLYSTADDVTMRMVLSSARKSKECDDREDYPKSMRHTIHNLL